MLVVVVVVGVVELVEVRLDGTCRSSKYEGPDALAAVPVGAVHVQFVQESRYVVAVTAHRTYQVSSVHDKITGICAVVVEAE